MISVKSFSAVLLLVASLAAAAADPALPKCPPDWKVELIAEPPVLKHPSVVCCAPDGRVFVAEDPMDMGEASNKPVDRILCIHPDGKITVFAEGLYAVFGMQYLDGKVYVHHTPKFSVFTDDNGVGRDRKDLIDQTHPQPWVGGFNDHIPAGFRLAMDGFFYFSTGDKGIYGAAGRDGKAIEIRGGGVFRVRPDGTDLEVFSTGTRNHLDVAVNAEDEIFTYDNTDDGNGWNTRVTHMVDGGFYGYPWDYKPRRPYTLWMILDYGGGSPTGAIAYNEDALPPEYHGNIFFSEWGRSQLLRLRVERDGATYRIASRQDILTRGGKEFRPVGPAISPDGMSFYICDWNYGGWKNKTVAGRLLKLTYTGPSRATPKPAWWLPAASGKPFHATTAELIEGLKHPAQSVRLVAQRRLAERGRRELQATYDLLADKNAPSRAKQHAVWVCDAVYALAPGNPGDIPIHVGYAADDPDASVRRQALRQLGLRGWMEGKCAAALRDADASVRFAAATALGRAGGNDAGDRGAAESAVRRLLEALRGEKDFFARYAQFTALGRIGRRHPSAWAHVVGGLADTDAAVREAAGFAFRGGYDEEAVRALAGFASGSSNPEAGRAAAVAILADLARKEQPWKGQWWGTQPVKSARPARTVDWAGTPAALTAIRGALKDAGPTVRKAAIEAVAAVGDRTSVPALVALFEDAAADTESRKAVLVALAALKDPGAAPLVLGVLQAPNGRNLEVLPEAVAAAEKIGGKPMVAGLTALLDNWTGSTAVPVPLLEALGTLKAAEAVPAVARQIRSGDAKVRAAAINALATIGGEPAAAAVLPLLNDKDVQTRRAAVTALGTVRSKTAIPALIKATLDPQTKFEAAGALAAMPDMRALDVYLDGLGSKSPALRDACRKAVSAVGPQALPVIERKIELTLLSPDVVGELQRIYGTVQPITDWSIVGPFPFPGPLRLNPARVDLNESYKGFDDKAVRWKKAKVGPGGRTALHTQFNPNSDCCAFAYGEIASATDRTVELVAGSDDGLIVWVNGVKVFENLGNRGWRADEFRIKAALKAGKNTVLAMISQGGGPWEFSIAYPAPRAGRLFEATPRKLDPAAYMKVAEQDTGDAKRGRTLFADAKGVGCIKCHKVRGEGGEVGPDLSGIALQHNRVQLAEGILFPSMRIQEGYRQTQILTTDGRVLAGILRGETPESVTLVDAEGKKHVLPRTEIEQLRTNDLSLMPEGLNANLTLAEFADVLAYLETLRDQPGNPPAKDEPKKPGNK